ncbi:unnamed protein product (macronuclear) [Paramecium tetraurelia]|uniref:Uncharacterized protein n=1 Tax=Paramecium tetraurelia TaxID=5888 RepID=A0BZB6_PARTE|nr:uncharacterized protein GSPATT00033736001 [Paramecium tetraurelia]CAK63883.1 unnamed protein product [Paramecium tetraurelia]|eukprot:XP_001431281.1 hypothetical protein (macronuclear) [Paramecium tetraurelia strain d4-2]
MQTKQIQQLNDNASQIQLTIKNMQIVITRIDSERIKLQSQFSQHVINVEYAVFETPLHSSQGQVALCQLAIKHSLKSFKA